MVLNFSWDGCNTQEKWKTKVMQNLGEGGDKVHYGICASGLFTRLRRHVEQNSDKGIFKRKTWNPHTGNRLRIYRTNNKMQELTALLPKNRAILVRDKTKVSKFKSRHRIQEKVITLKENYTWNTKRYRKNKCRKKRGSRNSSTTRQ